MGDAFKIKPGPRAMKAKERGKRAAEKGKPISANPYNHYPSMPGIGLAAWWEKGWKEATQ